MSTSTRLGNDVDSEFTRRRRRRCDGRPPPAAAALERPAADEKGARASGVPVALQRLRSPAEPGQRLREAEPDEVGEAPVPPLKVDPIRVRVAAARCRVRVPVVPHAPRPVEVAHERGLAVRRETPVLEVLPQEGQLLCPPHDLCLLRVRQPGRVVAAAGDLQARAPLTNVQPVALLEEARFHVACPRTMLVLVVGPRQVCIAHARYGNRAVLLGDDIAHGRPVEVVVDVEPVPILATRKGI
mmetsp:Transcript_40881/g.110540  ORF Transcript_40881/g.110540 Transcript_40881/m.110540 type:complete len:242 (+) Transcript_40881:17-742(+)